VDHGRGLLQPIADDRSLTVVDFFAQPPIWLYLLLGAAAIIMVFVYFTSRRGVYLGIIGVLALLGLVLLLIDLLAESDNENVVRATKEMIAAVGRHDLDGFAEHISPQFRTDEITKDEIVRQAKSAIPGIRSINGRMFDVTPATMGQIRNVSFMVDMTGTARGFTLDGTPVNLRLRYQKDADGKWRVRGFEVWNALGNQRYYP
jgi:hypothetical protein